MGAVRKSAVVWWRCMLTRIGMGDVPHAHECRVRIGREGALPCDDAVLSPSLSIGICADKQHRCGGP